MLRVAAIASEGAWRACAGLRRGLSWLLLSADRATSSLYSEMREISYLPMMPAQR